MSQGVERTDNNYDVWSQDLTPLVVVVVLEIKFHTKIT